MATQVTRSKRQRQTVRDHSPTVIDEFKGLWSRGAEDEAPPTYASDIMNYWWSGLGTISAASKRVKGICIRPGTTKNLTHNAAIDTIVRVHPYHKISGVRWLILDVNDDIYDTGSASPATPILSLANIDDFSVITLFDRAYITVHNRETGLSGEFVYVYDGTGTARAAAGTAPTTALAGATSATAGNVPIGGHLLAFAFETASGFITKPSPVIVYTAPGGQSIDLTSVDTGPAGTVKRHILASKTLINYDGNPDSIELFFVAELAGNVATALTIDFFDSGLVDSADHLFDQLETIPAGVFLCEHEGKLIVGGSFTDPSVAYVSKNGEPESINATDGFLTVSPGDGLGLKNGRSYKGNLYLFKYSRTYVTYDTGGSPTEWPIGIVDAGLGADCFSVSDVMESKGMHRDIIIIGNFAGIWAFDGHFGTAPLSWPILNFYATYYPNIVTNIAIDPLRCVFYVVVTGERILVGDFFDGFQNIKWTLFRFGSNGTAVLSPINGNVVMSAGDPQFMLAVTNNGDDFLFQFPALKVHDDTTRAIPLPVYRSGYMSDGSGSGRTMHYGLIRARLAGSVAATASISLHSEDATLSGVVTKAIADAFVNEYDYLFNMSTAKGVRWDFNITSAIDQYILIRRVTVFAEPIYNSRPI